MCIRDRQYKITRAGRAQGYHKQARFIVRVPIIFNKPVSYTHLTLPTKA